MYFGWKGGGYFLRIDGSKTNSRVVLVLPVCNLAPSIKAQGNEDFFAPLLKICIVIYHSCAKLRAIIELGAALWKFLVHKSVSLFTVTFGENVLTLAKSPLALKCMATVHIS